MNEFNIDILMTHLIEISINKHCKSIDNASNRESISMHYLNGYDCELIWCCTIHFQSVAHILMPILAKYDRKSVN